MRRELAQLGIQTPWQALQAARNFALTVWDPRRSDIQHGINTLIADGLRRAGPEAAAELERRQPEVAKLYAEAYDPPLDPSALARLPDGTLGREYARFITENRIDPLQTLVAMGTPTNLPQYFFRRAYKLHDLLHVALGCDASILGEVRIVSWSLGQSGNGPAHATGATGRAPAMALTVLLLHLVLRSPSDFRDAVRLAAEWMAYGEQTPPHVAMRFEDWLDRPVEEVRARVLPAVALAGH